MRGATVREFLSGLTGDLAHAMVLVGAASVAVVAGSAQVVGTGWQPG